MSIRSLKRLRRRLIPVLAIAAAIAPPAAQAKPMPDGGSSSGSAIVVPASGLDQTHVIPGYGAPRSVVATGAPVTVPAKSGGFTWGEAGYGLLIGLVGALAIAAAVVGLRRQKHAEPAF